MSTPILATKLYIPPSRPNIILRPHLIERLNDGLRQNHGFGRKLTLISAPAGFGKTTLVSEWVNQKDEGGGPVLSEVEGPVLSKAEGPVLSKAEGMKDESEEIVHSSSFILHPSRVAWLSLDDGDNDPARFLAYLVAALQTIAPKIGEGVLGMLQSPQPPPPESILTALLNEISTVPDNFILVLDDYHVIDAQPIDEALTFLLEHLPPQMHLVIATREDPNLPLPRLRVRSQLVELRATDLRFNLSEATDFFNQMMDLNLSDEDIAALEARTEGWIAGLQLAALALQGTISTQGHQDATSFIKSFTGSHHFVLDYLIEEVLQQQPDSVQTFLLRTSILDRLCGPLCDAVLGKDGGRMKDEENSSSFSFHPSSFVLEYLERANLFIVPLDNERRWYRYHHLFAGFLRQRLHQSIASATGDAEHGVAELHIRASQWYENKGLELEAFHHATAANDVDRAVRLIIGEGMPLHFRGAVTPVLNWLASQPAVELDARPALWVMYASALSMTGQTTGVEEKLQAAEAALEGLELDAKTRNLIGHIAAIRALLAVSQYQVETIIAQSHRALEYLHPNNLAVRTATIWKLGIAYQLQGDRVAAGRAYTEAMSISQASGNNVIYVAAAIGLGNVQETENRLSLAAQTYRHVLQLMGETPLSGAYEAHLGLARILYEWNDLDAAQQHGQQSVELARQIDNNDRVVACEVFLARLKLARGDVTGAATILAEAEQFARQHNFVYRLPEVAAAQVLALLRQGPLLHQGNLAAAAQLAEEYELPLSQARVHLAEGDPDEAIALLGPLRQQVEAKGWQDERLKVMILQAVALQAHSEKDKAVQVLGDALALAEPNGFIRIFVDEGLSMAHLLSEAAARGIMPDYTDRLLAAFEAEMQKSKDKSYLPSAQSLIEPLSQRELEVLQLIAQGLSNREISERLFLALDTVKGHNRRIYGKLQVQRRTEAVARARELGLV